MIETSTSQRSQDDVEVTDSFYTHEWLELVTGGVRKGMIVRMIIMTLE